MKYKLLTRIALLSALIFSASAHAAPIEQHNEVISAYRKYKDVDSISIKVPTVIEVSFSDEFIERENFTVLDKTSNSFEPLFFKREILDFETPLGVSAEPAIPNIGPVMDGNISTYADFPLPASAQGFTQIILTSVEPVTSSAVTTLLDQYVALPNFVEISAFVDGQNKIILSKKEMGQNTIYFPKTSSNRWSISYWYSQPLRVSELKLVQENNSENILNSIRFLAQPSHSYRIYFDSDRYVSASVGEAGDLSSSIDIKKISLVKSSDNPLYVIADTDNDGVPDVSDNCISSSNLDQIDLNANNRGDACDDFDQDGLNNEMDNCPNNPNVDQRDTDGDKIGDVCDTQESRLTEQYPWIPWVGIGFAALVIIVLFAMTASSSAQKKSDF